MKKVILSSVVAIVICLTLIVGATFAIFTSEAKVNVAITAGKVKVSAVLTDLATESLGVSQENGNFELGGSARINGAVLELKKMVPGDKATVTIDVENDSDVALKYCVKLVGTGDLVPGLESYALINGVEYAITGAENSTEWFSVNPGDPIGDIDVSVLLPWTAGNEYQEAVADLAIQLIAVQGNASDRYVADGVSVEDNTYFISNANGMFWFANQVNNAGNSFAGKTVELAADIDLQNRDWTPIGQTGATEFKGVFDGKGYTISNLAIDSEEEYGAHYSTGLFGWVESHGDDGEDITIKNLTIDGATVKGHHNVAVVVGYLYGTVENVTVKNATVSCTNANDDANGDKAGVIAGYVGESGTVVKACSAVDSAVDAGRDAGQIVGAAKAANVVGCTANNVTVVDNRTGTGANINEAIIGRVLG